MMFVAHAVAKLYTKSKTVIPVHGLLTLHFFLHPVVPCIKIINMLKNEQASYCTNWAVSLSLNDLAWL